MNNRPIKSVPELQENHWTFKARFKIKLNIGENKQANTVEATLKNQINTTEMLSTRRDPILLDLGFEVRDLSAEEKNNLKLSGSKF